MWQNLGTVALAMIQKRDINPAGGRSGNGHTPAELANRLRLLRIAYGHLQGSVRELGQSEFSRRCGMTVGAWNNAETGDNRLGLDNARRVRLTTGATLDWIYEGDEQGMPHSLMVEIKRLEEVQKTAKGLKQSPHPRSATSKT